MGATVGMMFDYRSSDPAAMRECARGCESAGVEHLWVVEDCFWWGGVSLAAAALASSESLTVGIGVMSAVTRNPAIMAMEIATLAGLGPGRFVPGIGHGLPEWMDQIGARPRSSMAALEETLTAVRRLLAGEEVTVDGAEVHLDRVRLDCVPSPVPPVLAGAQREKSLALAGRVADGVVLSDGGPRYVRWALERAGRPDDFRVVTLTVASVAADRRDAYRMACDHVAELVGARWPSYTVLPFFDELVHRIDGDGPTALLGMPADYWIELGAFGTLDDAHQHVDALGRAGADVAVVYPSVALDDPRRQVALAADIARG
jgi:5,10-methylenetetrahydromethanopterin reductase